MQVITIHPDNPQPRLVARATEVLRHDGLIVYPTDSCYALGCTMRAGDALDRLRRIRGIDDRHHLTLMCRDLADFGTYARIDNAQFRFLRQHTPGAYTFILAGTREIPRRILHSNRRTIGVRVPDHPIALALLAELGEPLVSSTLTLPGDDDPLDDLDEIRERLGRQVDAIVDGGSCGTTPTTVVDLSADGLVLVREGSGPIDWT